MVSHSPDILPPFISQAVADSFGPQLKQSLAADFELEVRQKICGTTCSLCAPALSHPAPPGVGAQSCPFRISVSFALRAVLAIRSACAHRRCSEHIGCARACSGAATYVPARASACARYRRMPSLRVALIILTERRLHSDRPSQVPGYGMKKLRFYQAPDAALAKKANGASESCRGKHACACFICFAKCAVKGLHQGDIREVVDGKIAPLKYQLRDGNDSILDLPINTTLIDAGLHGTVAHTKKPVDVMVRDPRRSPPGPPRLLFCTQFNPLLCDLDLGFTSARPPGCNPGTHCNSNICALRAADSARCVQFVSKRRVWRVLVFNARADVELSWPPPPRRPPHAARAPLRRPAEHHPAL